MTHPTPFFHAERCASLLGIDAHGPFELVEALREGLPTRAFVALASTLGVSESDLARMLAIPQRTLTRRLQAGRFKPEESERILRLARVIESAQELFSSRERVRHWLIRPAPALGGRTPLIYLDTDIGTREVENLLGRLKHGIPT
jgi:putative toxin-antitoxin system antitoxin component (TIGR02293 family)